MPGKGPKNKANSVHAEIAQLKALIAELAANKGSSKYSCCLSYDTGATPVSYVKFKPDKFTSTPGSLGTAGSESLVTTGKGTIKFGSITTDAVHVPEIARNLVSGIRIMKQGFTTVIANDKIIISTDLPKVSLDSIKATGSYNAESGLLELDPEHLDKDVINYFENEKSIAMTVTEKEEETRPAAEAPPEGPLRVCLNL